VHIVVEFASRNSSRYDQVFDPVCTLQLENARQFIQCCTRCHHIIDDPNTLTAYIGIAFERMTDILGAFLSRKTDLRRGIATANRKGSGEPQIHVFCQWLGNLNRLIEAAS
jgi:hypothetical protein